MRYKTINLFKLSHMLTTKATLPKNDGNFGLPFRNGHPARCFNGPRECGNVATSKAHDVAGNW